MDDAPGVRSAERSRRSILRNFVFSAGGAAMLGTITSGNRVSAAQTKMTPTAVGYQGTPQGTQRCDNCTQFEAPSSCKVVEGNIAASGWCKIYVKTPA
jgi:hypothetical protein